jgi:hypothetical protein
VYGQKGDLLAIMCILFSIFSRDWEGESILTITEWKNWASVKEVGRLRD